MELLSQPKMKYFEEELMVKNNRSQQVEENNTWGDAIIHIIQDFIRESSKGHLSGKAWANRSQNVREFANSSLWGVYKDSLHPALSDLNGWYRNRSEGIEVGSVGRSLFFILDFMFTRDTSFAGEIHKGMIPQFQMKHAIL